MIFASKLLTMSIKLFFLILFGFGYLTTNGQDTISYQRNIIELKETSVSTEGYHSCDIPEAFLPYLEGRTFDYSAYTYNDGTLIIRHWGLGCCLLLVQEIHIVEELDLLGSIPSQDTIVIGYNDSIERGVYLYCNSLIKKMSDDTSFICTFQPMGYHLTEMYYDVLWTGFKPAKDINKSIHQTKFERVYIALL